MYRRLLTLCLLMCLGACSTAPPPSAEAADPPEPSDPPVATPPRLAETAPVKTAPPGYAGDNLGQWLSWSEPDNGIVARVEYVILPNTYDAGAIYLRLENIGDEPRAVPAGEITARAWTGCFELHHWDGQQWRPMFWPEGVSWRFRSEPMPLELQPGESTLLGLTQGLPGALLASSHFKIVIKVPRIRVHEWEENPSDEGPWGHWVEGELLSGLHTETPPFPVVMTESMEAQREGQYTVPEVLPFAMSHYQSGGWFGSGLGSGPPDPVPLTDLIIGNRKRTAGLRLYPDDAVRMALDHLLADEDEDIHWRLYVAMLAAERGSELGREVIVTTIIDGEYQETRSALSTLSYLLYREEPPAWVIQEAIAAIEDERQVQRRNGTHTTVANLACGDYQNLTRPIGRQKIAEAVPALIRRAQTPRGANEYGTLIALGEIGDERAVPVMMGLLEARLDRGWGSSSITPVILTAVTRFKMAQAVPLLIKHVDLRGVASALGQIGDERAIPALRPLADEGDIDAMVALCQLGDRDPIETLVPEITNLRRSQFERLHALGEANETLDARMVSVLIGVIRDDPAGSVAYWAIAELGEHESAQAVQGLLASFDVDFEDKEFFKPAYQPQMYHAFIAQTLAEQTGQNFGNNPEAWRRWWHEEGQHDPRFE